MKQFLLFKLGPRHYALEVEEIQEIVENPLLHFIPCAPPFYCGAMNFHGEILPVLDLGIYLGLGELDPSDRVIVLAPRIAALALKVATARRIIALDLQELQLTADAAVFDFSSSSFALEGVNVSVLDLIQLLHHLKETFAASAGMEPVKLPGN